MKTLKITTFLILVLFSVQSVKAQDRQFVRTYQSNVLAKGAKDLEAWSTIRAGRKYFYNALDTRLEFEVGMTNKLQCAFYLNASHAAFAANFDSLGGIADTSVSRIFHRSQFSISNEWKLNLMNASTDPFGLALYAEFDFAPGKFEIENKLIFDKRTDKNIFALNLVNEYEINYEVEKGKTRSVGEDEPEIDLAFMHLLKPNFGLGLEMVNSNEIEDGNWNFSALYAGPTLFYSGNNYFVILNALPQLTNLHKTEDAPNNLVLNAREKLEVRILFGFSF